MLGNLILLLLALTLLLFIALLWLRHSLLQLLREVDHHQMLLQKDFEKRRDTVPYLLESARQAEAPSDSWRKLVEDRAALHSEWSLEKELHFEDTLYRYLKETADYSLKFLDAKKEIEELEAIIEKEKQELKNTIALFNEQRKQFPYSSATALFGFRELV